MQEIIKENFEIIIKEEHKRNELQLTVIRIENKIEELNASLDSPESEMELKKQEDALKIVEEEIKDFELRNEQKDEEELTPKRALVSLKNILRFMQLLCENHNPHLQNALREQTNKEGHLHGKSFDFISYMSKMLGMYQKIFNAETVDLGF